VFYRWQREFFENDIRLHIAIGHVTPKDMLVGRQSEIHAERDRKLEEVCQQRHLLRRQATRADADRRAAEQFPNTMGRCEDLLDASAGADDNPPASLPTLFFPASPQPDFIEKCSRSVEILVQTLEEHNAIQSRSPFRIWRSTPDRCA
jgi:hypothetical protein